MATWILLADIGVRGGLDHERADEVGPANEAFATLDSDRDNLAALERLGATLGRQGGAAGHSLPSLARSPTPSGSSTSMDALSRTQRCWRPSAEMPADLKPRSVRVRVNLCRIVGSVRTSVTVSASLVARSGKRSR